MFMEQAILTWIHLVAASIWVGGSIFLGVVLSPVLRQTVSSVQERLRLMVLVGRRFNMIAVPSLAILIVTGIYNSHALLANPHLLLASSYGTYLVTKIVLVVALIVVYVIHVRLIRGSVEEAIMSGNMGKAELQRLRRAIIILGEITVILSVAILLFAALMDAGI